MAVSRTFANCNRRERNKPNTIRLSESHSLVAACDESMTKYHGGCDDERARMLDVVVRRVRADFGSVGRFGTGRFAGIGAASFGRHAASEFAGLSVVARVNAVGGVGHGFADGLANSTGVPVLAAVFRYSRRCSGTRGGVPVLAAVFRYSRRGRRDEVVPGRSSLCEARQRLGVEPLRE
jgi:hypothetical protein